MNREPKWIRLGVIAILIGLCLTMLAPFTWMVLTSFKPLQEVESVNPIPKSWQPNNYQEVFNKVHFARFYANSVFVAAWVTFLTILTSSMAAFAFCRLQWNGRDLVFKLYLATMMIPGVVTMIPNYAIIVKFGLLDTFSGLIIPASFSAFGTFLLRQFMLTIPSALDEAATIDGATAWQVFWNIAMPMSRSGLVTLAVFTFMGNYGSFYWPLLIVKSEHMRTLPVGLMYFDTMYGRTTNLMMAASVMSLLPPIIVFVLLQKQLIKGIQLGGVKG
ncbi:MAG: carbohydrate ABC transporter permease [Armatimonadota bacterium]